MLLLPIKYLKARIICKETLLSLLLMLTARISAQDYNFRNFDSEEGLAQSYIYSILQDTQGYLWIGTGEGLMRYNGFTLTKYTTGDSLADNFITCGISDGENLWFGHMNGRFSCFHQKAFHAVDLPQSNGSPVTCFAKSPDGQLFASTYSDGILKLSEEKGVIKQYLLKDEALIVTFAFIHDLDMLVGTTTGLLFCRLMESGEIETIRPVMEIPESKITCILKMRNGKGFYIATENDGIFLLSGEGKTFEVSKLNIAKEDDFTGIQRIYEDSRSDLWICTFGNGLIKMHLSTREDLPGIKYYNLSNGFASNNIKTIFEDREGNLWSGNYGEGLTRIVPKTLSVIALNNPAYGTSIFSMYFNRQYKWIGVENGLIKMDQSTGRIIMFYGKDSGLPKDTVTAVYSIKGKELWIGTERNGLFRMEVSSGKIRKYQIGTGDLENSVTCITGKGDQIWIGTKKGLCCLNYVTGRITWYSISQGGLPHNLIIGLLIDKADRLWVTTRSNILSYIQDDKVYKIPVNSVTGVLVLGPIAEDEDARIWVGSIGHGVFMIGTDSIRNITVKESLLSNFCYSLVCDSNKNLWVGHKGGLSRISTTDFSVKCLPQINEEADEYWFNPNAVLRDSLERIWFGSNRGLVSYDPSLEYSRFPPPVLGITALVINDEEMDFQDRIMLTPGKYKIHIEFLGINLKEPSLVAYQYKLDGYDQWSEVTKNTSVTYNHLSEGEYTFMVIASSGDGAVSDNPLTLHIVIKKPFWKKLWFYMVGVLTLILLTLSYIKRREYRFRVERKILEEKVKERTIEIQNQKNEIELQRDLINKKNADITSSIIYACDIQNAILPPLEFISKFLPDSFIMSKPKDIVSGDFYWLAEREGKIVFTIADCTGHGVPGAFMSLLGITLLNEIVNIQGITRSDAIVTNLRERVIHALQQNRKDITTTDGIDIALCVMEKGRNVIQFTGGMNDLVFIRKGNLEVIKGDHVSVSADYKDSNCFTMKEIVYKKGDIFYLFSDGFQDQFGGERNRKYLVHRFYKTLLEIYKLPMKKQKEILEQKLQDWMKDNIQTDDITVMGIRL